MFDGAKITLATSVKSSKRRFYTIMMNKYCINGVFKRTDLNKYDKKDITAFLIILQTQTLTHESLF